MQAFPEALSATGRVHHLEAPGLPARRKPKPEPHGSDTLHLVLFDTPLGSMAAAADCSRVCLLTFVDGRELAAARAELDRLFRAPVVSAENPILWQLRGELREYFQGQRRGFDVPFRLLGTGFQCRVWTELQRIPYGQTASYQGVAIAVGNPDAVRAVGRANATNRLCLLVPCHRVIAKDGTLGGYGGGAWRKRSLLEIERG